MKCPMCDGTGMCHDEEMRFDCPVCHGTGEYFPTNEEWLRTATREELAEVFVTICKNAFNAEDYRNKRWEDFQNKNYWKRWLKEKHTDGNT